MRRTWILALFLAGCSSAGSGNMMNGLSLSVSPLPATPSDEVTLLLRNESSDPVGYNLCPSTLALQTGDAWTPIPSDRICTMELRTLEVGQADSFTLELPADLEPGTYRFQTTVELLEQGGRTEVATDPFTVEG